MKDSECNFFYVEIYEHYIEWILSRPNDECDIED